MNINKLKVNAANSTASQMSPRGDVSTDKIKDPRVVRRTAHLAVNNMLLKYMPREMLLPNGEIKYTPPKFKVRRAIEEADSP